VGAGVAVFWALTTACASLVKNGQAGTVQPEEFVTDARSAGGPDGGHPAGTAAHPSGGPRSTERIGFDLTDARRLVAAQPFCR
jgi:hypothetical protein